MIVESSADHRTLVLGQFMTEGANGNGSVLASQAHEQLQRLIETCPALLHTGRGDGWLDYFNRGWLAYVGATLEEVCGWNWINYIHPDDVDGFVRAWKDTVASGQPLVAESRVRGADGHYRWFLHRKVAVRDEQGIVIKWLGASVEIEERKRAEEALRRSEHYLTEAQRLSKTGSFVWNTATNELTWSEELFRLHEFDLTTKPSLELALTRVHPDDRPLLDRTIGVAASSGQPLDVDFRLVMPNGSIKHVHVVACIVGQKSGGFEYVGTGIDVTASRLAFQEIQKVKDQLHKENIAFREEIDASSMLEEIVGSSEALRRVISQVAKVAGTESTVLITGETGTGKELIARAIHKRSARANRPFIRLNCAAIPPSLIASELFGHEKGAFTGATNRRQGRFEMANGGTLFLDEIGELRAETQIALLRVLQEREIERIGGGAVIPVDVRIIAATNRELPSAIEEGKFRQDLYYRLNVFPIHAPPLRHRKDDIPLLVTYLIKRFAARAGKNILHIAKHTLDRFQTYEWPGNIRELQNVIERAVILCDSDTLQIEDSWLQAGKCQAVEERVTLDSSLDHREREMIEAALTACKGRVAGASGAAAKLGIPRTTLESRIKSLGISKQRFKS